MVGVILGRLISEVHKNFNVGEGDLYFRLACNPLICIIHSSSIIHIRGVIEDF